jgi:hypothetical protein
MALFTLGGQVSAHTVGGGGGRSRVRSFACVNVRAAPHIEDMRPNGWTGRIPNWYKHLLGQWTQVMVVGDREYALMRVLRAQTCAQHHLSSIGARRAGPIEPQIGTKTHWGNEHKFGGLRARSPRTPHNRGGAAVSRERGARERALSARTSAKRESTGMEQEHGAKKCCPTPD